MRRTFIADWGSRISDYGSPRAASPRGGGQGGLAIRNRSGFTLVELIIAVVILSLVMMALYLILYNSSVTYTNLTRLGDLQTRARLVTDEISKEMRAADTFQRFSLPKNSMNLTTISFRVPKRVDSASGAIIWSDMTDPGPIPAGYYAGSPYPPTPALVCYRYELSNVDANNNTKKDDGRLVRVLLEPSLLTDLAGTHRVLSDYLQPPIAGNEIFTRGNDDTVTVNLTFMIADNKNKLLTQKVLTSVSLRNNTSP